MSYLTPYHSFMHLRGTKAISVDNNVDNSVDNNAENAVRYVGKNVTRFDWTSVYQVDVAGLRVAGLRVANVTPRGIDNCSGIGLGKRDVVGMRNVIGMGTVKVGHT